MTRKNSLETIPQNITKFTNSNEHKISAINLNVYNVQGVLYFYNFKIEIKTMPGGVWI